MGLETLSRMTRKVGGRYEVGLIWKDPAVTLPNNSVVVESRLEMLKKRLENNPQLKAKYEETIENDWEKGYIKRLRDQDLSDPVSHEWYLPHHPVLHHHKPEKVRQSSKRCSSPISTNFLQ